MPQSKRNFFIAGLPRSRTAWLANLLTTKDSFCFHEVIGRTGMLPERTDKYVGSAETCSYLIPEGSKTVIIHRSVDDCMASMAKSFDITNAELDLLRAAFEVESVALYKLSGLHIDFEDIDDNIEHIWKYLLPSIPVDLDRVAEMKRVNVSLNTRILSEVI